MNTRAMWAIIRRDVRNVWSTKTTAIPMIAVPVLLFARPTAGRRLRPPGAQPAQRRHRHARRRPPTGTAGGAAHRPGRRLAVLLLGYLLAPLFLLVPLLLSIIAAAGAIAGERERRTLETLLLSPVSDRELFIAKTAAAWLPAMAVTIAGAVIHSTIAGVVLADSGAPPTLLWVLLIGWAAPALAAAALGAVVIVSARARSYQDAMQIGGLLVLPLGAVVAAQASGLLTLGSPPSPWPASSCGASPPCCCGRAHRRCAATVSQCDCNNTNANLLEIGTGMLTFRDKPTLKGAHVTLRPFTDADLPALWAMVNDDEGNRLTGTHTPSTNEPATSTGASASSSKASVASTALGRQVATTPS